MGRSRWARSAQRSYWRGTGLVAGLKLGRVLVDWVGSLGRVPRAVPNKMNHRAAVDQSGWSKFAAVGGSRMQWRSLLEQEHLEQLEFPAGSK